MLNDIGEVKIEFLSNVCLAAILSWHGKIWTFSELNGYSNYARRDKGEFNREFRVLGLNLPVFELIELVSIRMDLSFLIRFRVDPVRAF